MPSEKTPGLVEIIADYRARKWASDLRMDWAIAILARLPSFLLIWLFARRKIAPLSVTYASILLALSLPLLALFLPAAVASIVVFICAWLFQILDCTDGGLARATGTVSDRGEQIDFLADMLQWAMLYAAIGILADRQFDSGWTWTALGILAAWGRLFGRIIDDTLGAKSSASIGDQPKFSLQQVPLAFVTGLSGALPFLALAGDYLHLAVYGLLVYSLLDIANNLRPALKSPPGATLPP